MFHTESGCDLQRFEGFPIFLHYHIVMVSVGVLHPCQSIKATLIFGVFGNSCSCWGPSSESGDSEKPVGRFPLHSERKPFYLLAIFCLAFQPPNFKLTCLLIGGLEDWAPQKGNYFICTPQKKSGADFFEGKPIQNVCFLDFGPVSSSNPQSHLTWQLSNKWRRNFQKVFPNQGSLYYQPKHLTIIKEIPQNYHRFVLFDPPNMGPI